MYVYEIKFMAAENLRFKITHLHLVKVVYILNLIIYQKPWYTRPVEMKRYWKSMKGIELYFQLYSNAPPITLNWVKCENHTVEAFIIRNILLRTIHTECTFSKNKMECFLIYYLPIAYFRIEVRGFRFFFLPYATFVTLCESKNILCRV